MNRLSFRGPVAVRQLRRAHGGRESRRIALYTWVLVLLLCCNLASTEDFTYAEGFTSAALGQLAAGSAFVGPDRHVSGAAYMCLLTADFLGPAAHAQQCSTFSWYFIQGGASGGSWPTKQHSKDFEFCTDGHQAKPRSIHLLYTWKSANQDKVGLLRAPRAASGSGLTLSYDKNVHTVLNEDLWSMLPSSGKKAMCWTGPGRRLVVLDNSETGKYPHSSSCFKLRASKEDQNAYHAVRSDVVFGLAVAFCRLQYLSCRFLSIALCVMSRLVDYSTCRVAFSRLRYVSMIPCRVYCIVDYITCRVAFSHRQRFRFSERPTFEPRRRVVSVTDFGYSFEIQQALDKRTPSLPPYGT